MYHACQAAILLLLVLALPSSGCSRNNALPVHGKVTLDGTPVESGNISFLPTAAAGTKAAAPIEHGEYTIPAVGGVAPGKYRVEISWRKPTGRKVASADPGISMDETREAIPEKYNAGSTLTAEISAAKSEHDFSLTSK